MTGPSRPLLRVSGLQKYYGSGPERVFALRSVNLSVGVGEFIAIMGPSGAGKSTLLNLLGLLDTASGGTYEFDGTDVSGLRESEQNLLRAHVIGFVFQQSHVLLADSAADNAALGLRVQGVRRREREERVTRALDLLDLLPRSEELGKNLSGGERQRVAIARAVATRPRLILADEPTGALDSANSARIMSYLRELNRGGVSVILITHDREVAAAADRTVHLVDGVLDDGSAERKPDSALPAETAGVPSRPGVQRGGGWPRRALDEIAQALSIHTGKPGRSLLLLLAFLLGTGGLVASMGLNASAAAQVSERITRAGLDEVVVSGKDPTLAESADTAARIRALEGVSGVGYRAIIATADARVSLLPPDSVPVAARFTGRIQLADPDYVRLQAPSIVPNGAWTLLENDWGGNIALLGRDAARDLGIHSAGPGKQIWVGGIALDVVGIISDPGRDELLANTILLSPGLRDRLPVSEPELLVRTQPGFPAAVAEAIPLAVSPGDPAAVRVSTVADLRNLGRGVSTDLGTLMGIIAGVLLALASLSAATAMYLSVQARAAEIALRRAIGASRASIWRMFTLEGLTIGLGGGIAGSAVGMMGVLIACAAQGWTPTLAPSAVGVGIGAGAITGILASAYPALVAARAHPADAIRG